ncbi:MAG TPA: LacI family DNA-binding transcriptional regulator [Pseudonocardia sp.]|nr:LacI family DNA-binding transcriptional regulator [Pseudonocardia sp.]
MAVTRAEVARRAGVSPAVVSYVLNSGPRPVAPATRARVEAAIAELGYRPNAMARALRGSGTRSIGLIVPDQVNPFFAELAHEVEDASFEHGYVLLVGSATEDPAREVSYLQTFLDRKVDAILLISVHSRPDLAAVTAAGVPVVVLDRIPAIDGVSTVTVDGSEGARTGVQHLIGHGHRTVACIAGPPRLGSAEQRLAGWTAAVREAGLPHGHAMVVQEAFTAAGGYRAAHALLQRADRPSAVFVSTDVQALGLLSACSELGVDVPRDLAVVSFDGSEAGRYSAPALTSVAQPVEQLARRAVAHLLEAVRDTGTAPAHDTLETRLVVRRSCGCGSA